MFKVDLTKDISPKDVIYIVVAVLFSYGVYISNLNLITIYAFNGAVVGYTYVFFIPTWIHLKCLWWDHSCGFVEGDQ